MAMIWPSEKAPPNAGMAPGLPLRIRATMKSSLRLVPASFGPLPSVRPPSWWQKPHTEANRVGPSMSLGDASGGGGAVVLAAALGLCCAQTQATGSATVTSTAPVRRIDIHITSAGGPPTLPPFAGEEGRAGGRPSLLLLEREHEQGAGILRHALEGLAPQRRKLVGHQAAPTGRHGDVLLAAGHVADDAGVVAHAVAMRPQFLSGLGVVGVHDAFAVRHAKEIAAGGENAGERRLLVVDLPLLGARHRIAGVEAAARRPVRRSHQLEVSADIELRHRLKNRRGPDHRDVHAPFLRNLVIELGFRAVSARVPADAAGDRRAQRRVGLAGVEIAPADQFAGLRIDAFHEVDVLRELPDILHLAVGAVVDKNETALVRVHHELLPAAVDRQEFAHRRVEVPGVVRQLLMVELELAGVGIEPDD